MHSMSGQQYPIPATSYTHTNTEVLQVTDNQVLKAIRAYLTSAKGTGTESTWPTRGSKDGGDGEELAFSEAGASTSASPGFTDGLKL
jgi:hypothetical protein